MPRASHPVMRPQRAYATRQPLLLVLAGTRLRCASRSVPLEAARAAWSLQVTCSSTRGALPLPHSAARWHTRAAPLPAPAMTLQLCESIVTRKRGNLQDSADDGSVTGRRCSRPKKGVVELQKANDNARKNRKRMCCIWWCLVIALVAMLFPMLASALQ
jgi:hypothetical protein